MKKHTRREPAVAGLAALLLFFSVALIVTVTFLVFLRSIDLDESQIRSAAPYTFLVVLLITVIFLAVWEAVRYLTVLQPAQKLEKSLEKIATGDFSERLDASSLPGNFGQIAQSINRMTDELSHAEILKTDFISNVSHELKTPLAAVQNYAALLQSPLLSEEERLEYAKSISAAAQRTNELVTNILRLNRLENQKLEVKKERFDLSSQLAEILLQFENIWEEKNITPIFEGEEELFVTSDKELLALVWNNLLSNAFKFTDTGGEVRVTLTASSGKVHVSVQDTGCGMDAETGRHIFDKFYQGDSSHATQGNGLGLALVRRVIDLTGAEIEVSSTPGEGSCFTVSLPAGKEVLHA